MSVAKNRKRIRVNSDICKLPGITKRRQGDPGGVSRRKIRWEKLDQVGYRNHVEAGIRSITLDTESPSELNGKLQSFCDVLVAAAEKNAPQTRRGKRSVTGQKR